MQVSVIIPFYNSQARIRQTLETVMSQSLRPMEIIVVDDGSTDRSSEIIKDFRDIILLQNPLKGANHARSWGFKFSKAPFVTFLDSDDLWSPGHLQVLAKVFSENPSVPAAVAGSRHFLSPDAKLPQAVEFIPESFQPWDLFPFTGIDTPSAMVIRREALEAIGRLPTQFGEICENHMALKLSTLHPLIKNKSITVGRRIHKHQLSNKLRVDDPEGYLKTLIASLENALDYRLTNRKNDKEKLLNRLEIMKLILQILQAVISSEWKTLEFYAQKLMRQTSRQSKFFINKSYTSLVWWILPIIYRDELENQRGIAKILFANWPVEAERAYYMLFNNLPVLRGNLSTQ